MADVDSRAARLVGEAFWILLGRPASPTELRDGARACSHGSEWYLLARLLASAEFGGAREAWRLNPPTHDVDALERGLASLGSAENFVSRVYACVLGRPADAGGLAHYASGLAAGGRRADVVRALALSEECDRHLRDLAIPRDVQLCELANPAKWDNPEWLGILADMGLSVDRRDMHRKPYEFAQLVFACRALGALREDSQVISVGAGHEQILYWLANHVRQVIATDMYEGVWQDVQGREGDPRVIEHPEDYAPFPYRRDHLLFMRMDGRKLAFADGTFDIAYSLSSIEHFGSFEASAEAVREMGRVLKPGGILALATEFVLSGPAHDETFQPAEFAALIDQPGLRLVQPMDVDVYRRYAYTAIDLYRNPYQAPHMVVRFNDTVFTTGMVFLERV